MINCIKSIFKPKNLTICRYFIQSASVSLPRASIVLCLLLDPNCSSFDLKKVSEKNAFSQLSKLLPYKRR